MKDLVIKRSLFRFFILILVFATTADEFADGLFISISDLAPQKVGLLIAYELSQMIFSPLQAALSDLYCRRKMLIFTITATLIASLIFKFFGSYTVSIQYITIIAIGMFANTLPIAWGGIADIVPSGKFRAYLAWAICFYAIGNWGTFYLIPILKPFSYFILVCIIVLLSDVGAIFFSDSRDKDPHDERKMLHAKTANIENRMVRFVLSVKIAIWELIKFSHVYRIIIGFLVFTISEIAFFQVFMRIELLKTFSSIVPIALTSGIGYLIGTIALTYSNAHDLKATYRGLVASVIFLFSAYFVLSLGFHNAIVLVLLYGFYSLSVAFFTPSLFSLIRPKGSSHHGGKLFGLMDSGESLAKVVVTWFVLSTPSLNLNKVLLVSVFILVWALLLVTYISIRSRRET